MMHKAMRTLEPGEQLFVPLVDREPFTLGLRPRDRLHPVFPRLSVLKWSTPGQNVRDREPTADEVRPIGVNSGRAYDYDGSRHYEARRVEAAALAHFGIQDRAALDRLIEEKLLDIAPEDYE